MFKKILFLILIYVLVIIFVPKFDNFSNIKQIDNFDKVYNVNVSCGGSNCCNNQNPDVIVPVYSPWRTYYPWSAVYPYNWNYPYYWSQYDFW